MKDEERAREIAEHAGIDMLDDHYLFIAEIESALEFVRAEATRAEQERIAVKLVEQANEARRRALSSPGEIPTKYFLIADGLDCQAAARTATQEEGIGDAYNILRAAFSWFDLHEIERKLNYVPQWYAMARDLLAASPTPEKPG